MNADIPPERPVRRYRRGRAHRLENTVTSALVRLGLIPHSYLLTTRGRRTGRPRSNPVTVVEHDGHRWLVAPYGAVPWVHNARAAGVVRLIRRCTARSYTVEEVSAREAGPVLKRYVAVASATRDYFRADPGAPAAEFEKEAGLHPVFRLTEVPEREGE